MLSYWVNLTKRVHLNIVQGSFFLHVFALISMQRRHLFRASLFHSPRLHSIHFGAISSETIGSRFFISLSEMTSIFQNPESLKAIFSGEKTHNFATYFQPRRDYCPSWRIPLLWLFLSPEMAENSSNSISPTSEKRRCMSRSLTSTPTFQVPSTGYHG